MIRRLIFALFLLCGSLSAQTNYFITTGGSDSNVCSAGSPCRTINGVDAKLNNGTLAKGAAGTVIDVACGTYTGPITTNASGTSTARIVWNSHTRSLSGSGCVLINTINWNSNGSFVDVVGFEGTSPAGTNQIAFGFGPSSSHGSLQNNYFHDFDVNSCMQAGVVDVSAGVPNPNQATASHDNLIKGNIIRHAGNYNSTDNGTINFCVNLHGIYDNGYNNIIENNIVSGITGWGIKVGQSPFSQNDVVANNTIFNNGGGILFTQCSNTSCGTMDHVTVNNNLVVNNGVDAPQGGRFGINFYHVSGQNWVVTNNMVYGNLPFNFAHHDNECPSAGQPNAGNGGIPISGNDGDGSAGGCPASNPKTDAGVTTTFINFQVDTPTSPTAGYSPNNYQLKAGSHAIVGGATPTDCATSPGQTPCAPATDFAGTSRTSGAQDIGAWAFTTAGVPIVNFSPSPLSFGTVSVSGNASLTETLRNTGSVNLTFTAATISGTNAADFTITNTAVSSPLTAGSSGTWTIRFTPSATGTRTANLTLNDNAAGSPHQLPLTGVGGSAGITLNPNSLNLGVVAPGSCSAIQTFTITSTGSSPLTLNTATQILGANAAEFLFGGTGTCTQPSTLNPGQSCLVSIKLCPITAGAKVATVSQDTNAAGSPQAVPLSGTGGAPIATLAPTSAACGSQQVLTSQTCQTFTLTNTGNIDLTGIAVSITGANPTSFSQSNNCPATLAAAANCTITAFLNPQTAGALSANLSVASNASTSPNTAALTGTGNPPASIALSPTTVNFGNVIVGATSAPSGITVTNTGGTAATISGVTTALPFAQSNNCPASLGPGASCIVSVTASPSATGIANGTVSVASSASGSPFVASLSVTGVAPAVSLTPASIAFGSQPVGSQTTAQAFTLLNNGTSALTFTIALAGTNPGDFVLSTGCVSPLQPNQNCLISTAFKPTTAGARSAIVRVTDNASGSPHSSTVTGTGVATSPAVCLSVPSINFGNQAVGTSSGSRPVVVTNCGTANLVVSGVTPTGNFSQTNNCGTVLPNAICTINATFSPLSTGSLTGQLSIASNSASTPDLVALSGFGTTTGANLSPTTINFGSVTVGQQSTNQLVTLQNTGNTTLAVSGTTVTGANAGDFVSGSCPPTLAPNASCIYFATFIPTGPGSRTATLTQPFGGGVPSQTIALSGTGVAAVPAVTLVPTLLDFGNVTTSVTSAIKTVTVTNSGNAVLNSSSITVTGTNSADYAITNHCGLTLSAGANCTVDVTVTPSGTGARTANLHLVNDAASSPQNVPLTVNGVAAPAPRVSLSPTALSFSPPSIQTGTTSGAQTLTVVNIGNANLTVTHPVALGGSNPGDFTISDNCGTVAPGLSCTATVNCKPTAAGARTATVIFTSNASTSPDTATASCTGFVGTPNLVLAVSSINFGNTTVGTTSAQLVFTITNNGLATASGVVISATGDFAVTDTCGGSIPQGTGCTASVTFSPQILCGQTDPANPSSCLSNVHLGQVSVVSNTANSPQTISLQGTAIPVPPPPGPIKVTMGGKLVIGGKVVMGVQ